MASDKVFFYQFESLFGGHASCVYVKWNLHTHATHFRQIFCLFHIIIFGRFIFCSFYFVSSFFFCVERKGSKASIAASEENFEKTEQPKTSPVSQTENGEKTGKHIEKNDTQMQNNTIQNE